MAAIAAAPMERLRLRRHRSSAAVRCCWRRSRRARARAGAAGAAGRRSIPATSIGDDSSSSAPSSPTPSPAPTIHEAREALIGKVARRTLLPGQPIPVNAHPRSLPGDAGQDRAGRLRGRRAHHHRPMPWRCRTAASATSSALRNLDSGTVIKGTVAPDGTRPVGRRHDAPRSLLALCARACSRSRRRWRRRASRTSSRCRACAPTSSSATAW